MEEVKVLKRICSLPNAHCAHGRVWLYVGLPVGMLVLLGIGAFLLLGMRQTPSQLAVDVPTVPAEDAALGQMLPGGQRLMMATGEFRPEGRKSERKTRKGPFPYDVYTSDEMSSLALEADLEGYLPTLSFSDYAASPEAKKNPERLKAVAARSAAMLRENALQKAPAGGYPMLVKQLKNIQDKGQLETPHTPVLDALVTSLNSRECQTEGCVNTLQAVNAMYQGGVLDETTARVALQRVAEEDVDTAEVARQSVEETGVADMNRLENFTAAHIAKNFKAKGVNVILPNGETRYVQAEE